MPRLRAQKQIIKEWLQRPDWKSFIPKICEANMSSVGPLLSLLPSEAILQIRAANALGAVTAKIFTEHSEMARDIVRRLMWRLSEESGNIGWGVPEAFGEVLAQCAPLAKEFHQILATTILDLGFDDNYCDNDIMRRSCYFALGRFLSIQSQYASKIRPLLRKGLSDQDALCRGMAAWALGRLPLDLNDIPQLRQLSEAQDHALCSITNGDESKEYEVSHLATLALQGKLRENELP